ncbi:hypothetical protein SLEP1_g46301 [Rubroshorea leprosula]|uniref:Leucine-rich repeat-containing N-terminal plant-type domain-containing protein n=1 Tax=Rubroshorea leprosula TaxID=152421 RepID=A0AAV5LLS8_9ROSI|nr:hypothetical protein SLEP1_g46301 [Rubroshorea leprosula]
MRIFTKLSAPLCLLFVFLCLKTAFSTTHLCSHEEALALLQFKTSFSINYTASDPDYCDYQPNYSKIESWKEGIDCCSWDGVSCDNVTGHIIALNLSCSFLYGTFPSNSTLFFLRNLQSLNLALNDFRLSKIPPEISQFTRLKHLDVSSSQFSGQVPREIAHLPKLVSLNLSYNWDLILETTTLRYLVQNLSEVRELVLSGLSMTSVNPRFFMNLSSSLTTLRLFNCQLRGNFPNSIFRFPNLKRFSLGGKGNLTIDLPSSNWSSPLQDLYLVDMDQDLYLGDMDCGRRLRESIGDLKSLQYLSLGCNLEGSIPASIGNLSQLTYLSLSYNNLSGQIPSSLADLTQLTCLYLSNNQFSGPIPASIGNLRQLTSLDLSSNNLSGQIPSSLADLTQLTYLDLSNNQFSGPIPASIGNVRQLTSLDLSFNNLSGQIPSSLANLTQLTSLDLYNNQFSGPIPASIGNLRQLTSLVLYSNNLSGQIPSSLANLTQLTYLSLSDNQFSSRIPASIASIGNLSQLTYLMLSSNNFNRQIPSSLANLTQLTYLSLSYNLLNGTLPPWIFTLPLLEYLFLSHNQFQGQINQFRPNSMFSAFQNLKILDLSHNSLIGKIPNCLPKSLSVLNLQANYFDGNIAFGFPEGCGLRNLNLHGNQMDGLLPRSLVNCRMLEVLDVGNNNIGGTFPHWLESLLDLQVLVLRSNKFHGSVQSTKQSPSFPKLRVLDLSSNDFRGPLPVRYIENFKAMMDLYRDEDSPEYMNVSSYQCSVVVTWKGFDYELPGILTVFSSIHLSNNMFEGEIPDVIGKLSSLKGLNLSHNNLTVHLRSLSVESNHLGGDQGEVLGLDLESLKILLKRGVFIGAMLYCLLVFACKRVLAVEGVVNVVRSD